MKRWMWIGLGLLVVLAMCWDAGGESEGPSTTASRAAETATPPSEPWAGVGLSTRRACEEFHEASVDAQGGRLTPEELRERLKGVSLLAHSSSREDVRRLGPEILKAYENGSVEEFQTALAAMDTACAAAVRGEGN